VYKNRTSLPNDKWFKGSNNTGHSYIYTTNKTNNNVVLSLYIYLFYFVATLVNHQLAFNITVLNNEVSFNIFIPVN
jgi:hypothetical protein